MTTASARAFVAGTLLTLLAFALANLLVAHLLSDCGLLGALNLAGCADDIRRAGFPLLVFEEGGFSYRSSFSPGALLADLLIALIAGALVGWGCARRRPR